MKLEKAYMLLYYGHNFVVLCPVIFAEKNHNVLCNFFKGTPNTEMVQCINTKLVVGEPVLVVDL